MPTTEGGLDLKLNLTHALDGFSGNEHSLPIVPLFGDVVELFAAVGDHLHADAAGGLRRAVRRELLLHDDGIHDDPKVRRFIPHEEIDQRRQGGARRGSRTTSMSSR